MDNNQIARILHLQQKMQMGELIVKKKEAEKYKVNERTIQRDIDAIRNYYADTFSNEKRVIYDRTLKGYRLEEDRQNELTNSQIFAVCKILLESRSMTKAEMLPILEKLIRKCVPTTEYKKVENLISNEKAHYLEPHHGRVFVERMWDIATAVNEKLYLQITYEKPTAQEPVIRIVRPVGIMFSEFYFYLTAFICRADDLSEIPKSDFPTIYRIDRIQSYEILKEHFSVPYADRFEEGEFRKRIQFMTGGKLRIIKFRYKGGSLEAILDRLPTAEIMSHDENGYIIRAEVYGNGVDMWIRSQGNNIEMINNEEGELK